MGGLKRGHSYPQVLIIDSDTRALSVTPLLSSPTAPVELCTAACSCFHMQYFSLEPCATDLILPKALSCITGFPSSNIKTELLVSPRPYRSDQICRCLLSPPISVTIYTQNPTRCFFFKSNKCFSFGTEKKL